MRPSFLVPLAALAGLSAALLLGAGLARADGRSKRADVIAVEDIKPGMKGYGLTVFEGTRPQKFDVEVIDVLKNFRPRQELILVKTHHPRLEIAKVVAGMSGSPIYLNGKMAGAYAYGWTFGKEPVAGVTPIRSMLDDIERPLPKLINGWPLRFLPKKPSKAAALRSLSDQNRYAGSIDDYDLEQHAEQVARSKRRVGLSSSSPVRPVATPLLIGGMTADSIDVARGLLAPLGLEPLQAGGGGGIEKDAPTRYEDGGAVGVQLIRGDMSAMGLGTVTRVEGDKLVGFGHPMMNAGVTALPTAVGRVLWFLASEARSFKIGMPARPLGALVNDRQASIVVSHSAKAPVIPVDIEITGVPGAPFTRWSFEVAHEKFMSPTFMAVALGNAMQTTAADRQDVSWNAVSKLKVKGYPELVLEDFGVAVGGTPNPRDFIRSDLVQAVGALLNNPWEPVVIERATMKVELRYAREILRLRGAEALDREVEAGESVRVRLTLIPFAGPPRKRVITVPIPKHLAGKTVALSISPGHEVQRERAAPENLADLVASLEDPIYPPKSVVVSYSVGGAVAFKGHVARNLPPGAMDALRPTTATIAPTAFKSEVRKVVMLPEFMVGKDTVTIKVKPVLR